MPQLYRVTSDGKARPASRILTTDEAVELRDLLAENTFLLPGDQISPDDPRRWLLISKEMPVPDPTSATNRWSVDLLLTDQSGTPTFVECKRYADTRARREVVGQMLEYAANGHFYWDRSEILSRLEMRASEKGCTADELVQDLQPDSADSAESLVGTFIENLREGQVRLVFFMEEAPKELKSIVDFLNRQTERTEILIVEAQYFDEGGDRFVVPTLFGYTEEARRAKRTVNVVTRSEGRQWDESSFFEAISQNQSEIETKVARRVLEWARSRGCEIWWGKGARHGSFVPILTADGQRHQLFAVWTTSGLEVYFYWYAYKDAFSDPRVRLEIAQRLSKIDGIEFGEEHIHRRPSFPLGLLEGEGSWEVFSETFDWVISVAKGEARGSSGQDQP